MRRKKIHTGRGNAVEEDSHEEMSLSYICVRIIDKIWNSLREDSRAMCIRGKCYASLDNCLKAVSDYRWLSAEETMSLLFTTKT